MMNLRNQLRSQVNLGPKNHAVKAHRRHEDKAPHLLSLETSWR
jgi:hypothetical protein